MGKVEDTLKKFAKAMNDHDAKAVSALYADDAVAYDPLHPEPLRGRQAIEEDAANTFKAFSDLRVEVFNVIEKDDLNGAAEYSYKGMNDGPQATPGGDIPATNKRIEMRGGGFAKLNQSGQIVEERRYYDTGQLMQQLGLSGAPPTAAKDAR